MNKIFTQIALGTALLFANVANAQVTQNFTSVPPNSDCWSTNGFRAEEIKQKNFALLTQGNSTSSITTPYIDIPANGTVSLSYLTTAAKTTSLNLIISLVGTDGAKTPIANELIQGTKLVEIISPVVSAGLYRVVVEIINSGNTGTTYATIDDLIISGSLSSKSCIDLPEVIILPIHFMSFSGNANGNKAQLAWSVADNETGSHFEVERSTDGKKYQSVATVMTSTTVGAEKYDFTDVAFATSGSFYRIKVINKDNSTSYSKTVFIKGTTTVDNKLTLMQNPVQTTLNFSFTSATDEMNEVAIYNLAGVKMHSQKVQARKGTNSISLGMDSKFNKGAYILTVQSAAASRSVQLIKQ